MKSFLFVLAVLGLTFLATGSTSALVSRGYTKSNGTYVKPYHRTAPNSTRSDNYSTRGNTNPYTGTKGTKSPTKSYSSHSSRHY